MHGDNQDIIIFAKNLYFRERSKHIDICYYYIRDLVKKKKFIIEFIPTTEIPANRLTKPLARVTFEYFRD
jgi:hypothetical protein